jgi:plastocyanin
LCAVVGTSAASDAVPVAATINVGADENSWDPPQVRVAVGESVTWAWVETAALHNVASAGGNWTARSEYATSESFSYRFTADGTYGFRCELHPAMVGQVIVGTGVATPTPTATPTVTPAVTATATPTATATATPAPPVPLPAAPTPAPAAPPAPVRDTAKPTLSSVKPSAVAHGAKVRFKLSEPATVTVAIKRGAKTLKSVRTRSAAGTRTVTVKGSKVTRGRVTVELSAVDAAGNRSSVTRRSLSIKR